MPADLDQLEQQLLTLGRQELALEAKIRELQVLAREAGQASRFDESDAAWNLRERLRMTLSAVQASIMVIEKTLYGARRRQRR